MNKIFLGNQRDGYTIFNERDYRYGVHYEPSRDLLDDVLNAVDRNDKSFFERLAKFENVRPHHLGQMLAETVYHTTHAGYGWETAIGQHENVGAKLQTVWDTILKNMPDTKEAGTAIGLVLEAVVNNGRADLLQNLAGRVRQGQFLRLFEDHNFAVHFRDARGAALRYEKGGSRHVLREDGAGCRRALESIVYMANVRMEMDHPSEKQPAAAASAAGSVKKAMRALAQRISHKVPDAVKYAIRGRTQARPRVS